MESSHTLIHLSKQGFVYFTESFFYLHPPLFFIFLRLFISFWKMSIVILFSIFIFYFPILLPEYYASELLISFLPYLAILSLVFLIISFVHLRKKMKPWYRFPHQRYFRGISFLAFWFLFFWYSRQFNGFYIQKPFIQEQNTWTLKVLFANIHKNNTEYQAIQKTITDTNPDIIMFVEFSDHHYNHLKDFLHANYPYINTTTRSKTFVGNVVFSKYPINNKANDFPQGMRRYGYSSIAYQNQDIYFYLVHTSSPNTYTHYIMRNDQLHTLAANFQQHEQQEKHPNIIMVGDFNLTPWSTDYTTLTTAFSGELIDATSRIPFLFTWKLMEFPVLWAHIDHLWTTPSLNISSLHAITLPGSDHKGFLFTLSLK